ncbi:unnamed protein product [Rotaria sordida]|uniref:Glycosyltransferase family 92 protein n=1 Tax=Rotaria sordida TaxID=392033 RepID=A0A815ZGI9_9BILA|nr:unnamed protein product [Rotaria sordida]CAF1582965.1 unnamed protein product [Rotaria sordida]
MDAYYAKTVKDGFFKCIFFAAGTSRMLPSTNITRIGGQDIFDPHEHTLCLECVIPKEAVNSNTLTINLMLNHWHGFQHHATPSEWIAHQVWSQNDCIYRYGYLHSWMLISDVDEFVVPMGQYRNFDQILAVVPSNYCALQVLHYRFKALQSVGTSEPKYRLRNYVHRDRQHYSRDASSKNFVRPHLVHYFSVHQVTRSVKNSPVFYADVETHARLQHYRNELITPSEEKYFVIDTNIWSYLNQMKDTTTDSL